MTILSLCDYSGNWPKPYADNGHSVTLVDPKHPTGLHVGNDGITRFGGTVDDWSAISTEPFDIILAAPPCTHFASSGARWFTQKDADGRTDEAVQMIRGIIAYVKRTKPSVFALENPVGRLAALVPEVGKWRLIFDPCDYAGHANEPQKEAYTKRTCLWGWYNNDLPMSRVEPIYYHKGGKRGSWMWANLGGKSERTKELRSMTPQGFARAFYMANH